VFGLQHGFGSHIAEAKPSPAPYRGPTGLHRTRCRKRKNQLLQPQSLEAAIGVIGISAMTNSALNEGNSISQTLCRHRRNPSRFSNVYQRSCCDGRQSIDDGAVGRHDADRWCVKGRRSTQQLKAPSWRRRYDPHPKVEG
jgi:hypothetical protein